MFRGGSTGIFSSQDKTPVTKCILTKKVGKVLMRSNKRYKYLIDKGATGQLSGILGRDSDTSVVPHSKRQYPLRDVYDVSFSLCVFQLCEEDHNVGIWKAFEVLHVLRMSSPPNRKPYFPLGLFFSLHSQHRPAASFFAKNRPWNTALSGLPRL